MHRTPFSWRRVLAAPFLALVASVAFTGCASLPSLDGRTASSVILDTGHTRLGRAVGELVREHPGVSGVVTLPVGRDAFAARVLLADAAERSLDVQYYIWHPDMSGTLLIDALRRAADRGVRVRLLLDDNNTADFDKTLRALSDHRNIEVRLFNPFAMRTLRLLGYLTDFSRLNRRMHNKSFTADNQATIIGGRNVGDEYFGAGDELVFLDLDAMAIGPVVRDVSAQFDAYWGSGSAYPVERLLPPLDGNPDAVLDAAIDRIVDEPETRAYRAAVASSTFVADMTARRIAIEWARVRLISDPPTKVLDESDDSQMLLPRLLRAVGTPTQQLDLTSAYFVPEDKGVGDLTALAGSGVAVSVLTNSLESTDVPAVHSGYAGHRVALLQGGVRLYEMKRGGPPADSARNLVQGSIGGSGGSGGSGARVGSSGATGARSASSLHAKTFSIDGRQIFIGSFNVDPRSEHLNTEMGFVIDSPALTRTMEDRFTRYVRARAYEVRIGADGALEWVDHEGGGERVLHDEPGATFWNRIGLGFLSRLPIDWLL